MKPVKEIVKKLWQFKGLKPVADHHGVNITAGVQWLAETAECTWVLDTIAELQPEFDDSEFQYWSLTREFDDDGVPHALVLTCTPVVSRYRDDEPYAPDDEEINDDDIRQVIRMFDHPEYPLLETPFCVFVDGEGTRTLSLETEATQADERRTFLLPWNPKHFQWGEGDVAGNIATIEEYGVAYNEWSTGNTKSIQPGDRVFLIRLGVEPRGIVASGYAYTEIDEKEHWDPEKEAEGLTTCFVVVQWDEMLDSESEPILLESDLIRMSPGGFRWHVQSCISIPEDEARSVEEEWAKLLARRVGGHVGSAPPAGSNDEELPVRVPDDTTNASNPVMEDVVMEISRAGFGDPATNRRVEVAAIGTVTEWYRSNGWSVASVELDNCGYDLLCRREGLEEHVEVKGTQADTPAFIITANEYRQSQADAMFKLCVVASALSEGAVIHTHTGAELNEHFEFQALAYRATLKGHMD